MTINKETKDEGNGLLNGLTEEQLKEVDKISEMFGDRIPDPNQYPRCFQYYVKMYRYMKSLGQPEVSEIIDFT